MRKRSVLYFFIAMMIILPIQYVCVGIIGQLHSEPWPAFVLPGFKNVYVSNDNLFQIEQTKFLIKVDGQSDFAILLPHEFFPELPHSQVSGFMRTHFNSRLNFDSLSVDSKSFLYKQASKILGNEPISIELVSEVENYGFVDGELILESSKQFERLEIISYPMYFHEE